MIDPAGIIESRLLGEEQTAAATRAIRPLCPPPIGFRRVDRLWPEKRRHHGFSPSNPHRTLAAKLARADGATATAA
jgi:hypothetical protein